MECRSVFGRFSTALLILFLFSPVLAFSAPSKEYIFGLREQRSKIYKKQSEFDSFYKRNQYVMSPRQAIKFERGMGRYRWDLIELNLRAAEWSRDRISLEGAEARKDALAFYTEVLKVADPVVYGNGPIQYYVPATLKRCFKNTGNAVRLFLTSAVYWSLQSYFIIIGNTFGGNIAIKGVPFFGAAWLSYPIIGFIKDWRNCKSVPPNTPMSTLTINEVPGAGGLIFYANEMTQALQAGDLSAQFLKDDLLQGGVPTDEELVFQLKVSLDQLSHELGIFKRGRIKGLRHATKRLVREAVSQTPDPEKLEKYQKLVLKEFNRLSSEDLKKFSKRRLSLPYLVGVRRAVALIESKVNVNVNTPPVATGTPSKANDKDQEPKEATPDEDLNIRKKKGS